MNVSEYSIRKPITVLMGILITITLGFYSLTKMPLQLIPDLTVPYAAVVTTYEGANPYEVEEFVTTEIETALLSVNNVNSINSTSSEHFSLIVVEFQQSTNMDTAFLEMREKLELVNLKSDVGTPSIIKFDPSMIPVMSVSVSKEFEGVSSAENLILTSEWLESEIGFQLEAIDGVANVEYNGMSDTVLEIEFNEDKLASYSLSASDVLKIIENQNLEGLIGIVPDGEGIKMMYLGDEIKGIDSLKELPISYQNDEIVRIDDVLENIKYVNKSVNVFNKVNGKEAVTVSFQLQSGADITKTVARINEVLDTIAEDEEATFVRLFDQAKYINRAISSVLNNLIVGAVIALIVLFFFLRDLRPTITVGLSIPISVIAAFVLMWASGITLNMISMGGLTLGVGMLVDNSIVVIENIYRLLKKGYSRVEAAKVGAKQVMMAITASTLTTICVFLPFIFVENMFADIFVAMALTITYSLLASLIIAITLVPSLSSRFLKEKKVKEKKRENFFIRLYTATVKKALAHKFFVILLVVNFLFFSVILSQKNGFEILPVTDEGRITATLEMTKDTVFDQTVAVADYFSDQLEEIEEIEVIYVSVGGSGMGSMMGGGNDTATFSILLKDDRERTSFEISDQIEDIAINLDYSKIEGVDKSDVAKLGSQSTSQDSMMMGGGGAISYTLRGKNLYELETVANKIVELMESVEGSTDVSNGITKGNDVVQMKVNKDLAIKLGLVETDISRSISLFYDSFGFRLTDETKTGLIIPVDGQEYKLELPTQSFNLGGVSSTKFLSWINVFDSKTLELLEQKISENDPDFNLYMPNVMFFDAEKTIPNPMYNPMVEEGALVINSMLRVNYESMEVYTITFADIMSGNDKDTKLSDLARTTVYSGNENDSVVNVNPEATGFASINRDGKLRTLDVTANVKSGYVTSEIKTKINELVNDYMSSDEYLSNHKGVAIDYSDDVMSTINDIGLIILVAILLVYMIMAIQFQSLIYPFIVLLTIPLAYTGGLIALFVTGLPISMVAMIGLLVLTGIIVNNGIVLIDYTNQLRETGMSVDEALVEAGRTRLRPIFMTALTTSLALSTMAIGMGDGAELLQPLGITAIGGLIYGTILTPIFVPVVYRLFTRGD